MKIHIVGGGPAGLYFAILMKRLDQGHEIALFERDGPDDTFGWGIVFSDQTFGYLKDQDELTYTAITDTCERWDNVDVVHRGQKITVRGNRFSGIQRLQFLKILHARCEELGVDLRFQTRIADEELSSGPRSRASGLLDCDLLVGADGANSIVRRLHADTFRPTLEAGRNRYIWLGTPRLFHGLTLTFRASDAGPFAAHSYKFSASMSTFIVECGEETWARAGLDRMSERETCDYLARLFADDLEGRPLVTNNFVRWLTFLFVKNARWHNDRIVLLGDALHTAHFSIGSGTKLALEDAIALAACFRTDPNVAGALDRFERERKPVIEEYQEAARESQVWFEEIGRYMRLEPIELAYQLMTRSKKIDLDRLRQRDPAFIATYERARDSS
ncbi:MAG: FAD-dependent monooxygenase [Vicinamibacterales bacterium]